MIYCQIETKPCVFYVRLSISLCAYGDKRETKKSFNLGNDERED